MTDNLKPGEVMIEVADLSDRFAFCTVAQPDGSVRMAPDGVCVALAAVNRAGQPAEHMRLGSRFAAFLSPTRDGSTFQYFANRARLLAVGEGPAEVSLAETPM
jgi:hypothetical protein